MDPRVVSSLLLGLAACGPDLVEVPPPPEPLELLPICGQPSPFPLLALDEDQTPINRGSAVYRFEDRLYFVVGRANEQADGVYFDEQRIGNETTVYSTGPCGESPRVVATDVQSVLEHARWPGSLLGITRGGDLVVLDPEGEVEPRLLLEDVRPDFGWTEHGILATDVERGALLLRPYPASPDDAELEPRVLVEPFPDVPWQWGGGDDVFFLEDGALQRVDLRDGSRTVELAGGIESFVLAADGRFVVWQSPSDADGFRSVEVYDRVLGVGEWVGDTEQSVDVHDDHVLLWPRDLPGLSNRLVLLPSMDQVDVPPSVFLYERIDDARWLAWRNPQSWLVYDRTTGSARSLFEGLGTAWQHDDRLEVLFSDEPASPQLDAQGHLHAAWFDDRGPARIADRATTGHHHLADGRIVTPLDVDHGALGMLALTDLDGVTRWELDTEVVAWLGHFQAAAGYEDDVVVYGVSDGDRSGVWLARLPPAE